MIPTLLRRRSFFSSASILFVLGLFPSYVSIFFVEKHYTAFWTGIWNLYGLSLTSVGLALDNYDPLTVWLLFGLVALLAILVYILVFAEERGYYSAAREAEAYFIRRFGASWVTASLNWGVYVGFTVGFLWGVAVAIIHAVLMLALTDRLERAVFS